MALSHSARSGTAITVLDPDRNAGFGSAGIVEIGQELDVTLVDVLDHSGLQAPLGSKRCQSPPVG
ncbi:hypothetical protein SAV14893_082520 [Streptomyces avermitilis]|uniref:Uncharacterized protein n=1 Tax=Streptomyces avermitilis TaxID=33903 RepID=A0A4D4MB54_STRAX|nr:hypothetical protein SAV14893_082520 [Streptomyces avermitilis]GDY70759.1 hypothetical protein SAV31267_002440 [Streptomyces avermitilis]